MTIHSSLRQRGMSLVEVMVGLVIGMGVVLVVYQIVATFEGQKRTTIEGAGAQENGLFALTSLDRDIRMAGWGLTADGPRDCNSVHAALDDEDIAGFSFNPVSIRSGARGTADQITLVSGTSIAANAPTDVSEVRGNGQLVLGSTIGVHADDVVLVTNPDGSCNLGKITDLDTATNAIKRKPGGLNPTPRKSATWPQEQVGSQFYTLGALYSRTYRINADQVLEARDVDGSDATSVADNIVSIKAQYGIAADAVSPAVESWVNPVGSQWTDPSAADVQRIKAIRLFIVARSPIREKPESSGDCTTTKTVPQPAWDVALPAPIALPGEDWQCYRYRAFDTVVPLRNVIWANQ